MSILIRDPGEQKAREADYKAGVDNAMRTGAPFPPPLPVDAETIEFEKGIRFSDRRGANSLSAPMPASVAGRGGQLPERPIPLDQSFPVRVGVAPFSVGKGGR
jgi:hypothetical protein